jgi:hypothetical protein
MIVTEVLNSEFSSFGMFMAFFSVLPIDDALLISSLLVYNECGSSE